MLVQITSFKCTFIHVSQLTRWPLYVSPFLSSTSCGAKKGGFVSDAARAVRSSSTSGGRLPRDRLNARLGRRARRVRAPAEKARGWGLARRKRRLDVPLGGPGTSSAARGAASRAVVVLDCGTRAITLRRVNLSPTAEVSRRGKQGLRARSSGSVSENDRGRWVCVTDLPGAVACGDARAAARVRPANRISRKGPKTRSPVTRHQCLHRRVFINFAPAGF